MAMFTPFIAQAHPGHQHSGGIFDISTHMLISYSPYALFVVLISAAAIYTYRRKVKVKEF